MKFSIVMSIQITGYCQIDTEADTVDYPNPVIQAHTVFLFPPGFKLDDEGCTKVKARIQPMLLEACLEPGSSSPTAHSDLTPNERN